MTSRKTVLWLYDESRPYPTAQIAHVRQSLLVDLLPVSSTFQAITALQSTEPGHITHIVTCLARTEFGQPMPFAGLDLIKTVRLHNRAMPIALFSAVALSSPQLTAQTFAAAGVAGPQRNFDISSNTNDLITFLSRSGIPRRLAAATICLPTPGDRVVSDQTQMEYTIGNKLGEGAYAWVYECTDFFNQRLVAKVQKPQRAKKTVEDDWKKEQSFMQTVNHPNVITLYDTFVYNNLYFYILERADGTLRNHIPASGGGMAMELVLDLVPQILSGLTHIHQKRIVHRDLQIDNILLKHGPNNTIFAKISDFGISKLLSGAESEVQGTTGRPLDVAPEVLSNGTTTFLSDIYQLGLVFYQLHTGQHAVTGERVIDESVAAARKMARPDLYEAIKMGVPSQRAMTIGTPFARCVARMLAVAPKDRYQSTLEVWTDIYFACVAPLLQPVLVSGSPASVPLPIGQAQQAPVPQQPIAIAAVPSVPLPAAAPPPVPDRTSGTHVLSTPSVISGVSHFAAKAEDAIPASD